MKFRRKRLEKIKHPEACPMFQEPHHADHGDGHSDEGHGDGHGEEHSDGGHGNDHGGEHSEGGHENDHGDGHSDGHHGNDHHDGHSSHDTHDKKHEDVSIIDKLKMLLVFFSIKYSAVFIWISAKSLTCI